jgi:uncharacterized membrane protein
MDYYLTLKLIHIFSAFIVVGTGIGIAFFMFMAVRSRNTQAIYITAGHVVLADWLFTTPAVISQIVSGVLLMNSLGYSYSSTWFYWVASLVVFVGLCWIPVLKIQYKLRELAKCSIAQSAIYPEFTSLMRIWVLLGVPAFSAILVIFWIMVFKPFPLN